MSATDHEEGEPPDILETQSQPSHLRSSKHKHKHAPYHQHSKHKKHRHHRHESRGLTSSHDHDRSRSHHAHRSRHSHNEKRHVRSMSPHPSSQSQLGVGKKDGSVSPRRSHSHDDRTSSTSSTEEESRTEELPRNRSLDDLTAYARKMRSETSSILAPTESLSSSTNTLSQQAFFKTEGEKLQEFKETEGKAVVDDAADLLKQYMRQFESVSGNLRKPNVLLTGITGAGKSSLINSLFGKDVAATGTGVPITQHFTKYEDDDLRVVIYDSKGLEHGQFEEFIETTNDFFDDHKIGTHGESNDAIHVVWYIVNSAHSRFEPFEEHLCRELFNRAPLMFLLNKADISTQEDRDRFRKMITDLNLPNCVGVFDTVARRGAASLLSVEECPKCGSDDVIVRKKTQEMNCAECNYSQSLKQRNGLDDMIAATVRVLPEVVRDAFVSAQNVSFAMKEESSSMIIQEFYNEFNHVRMPAKLMKVVTKMMARLSIVWEFKKHGHIYGATMAKHLVSSISIGWKDRLKIAIHHKKSREQKLHVAALGILWNRCLRNLAMTLFKAWDELDFTKADSVETCRSLYEEIFSAMNKESLEEIEQSISVYNIKMVLDKEMRLSEQFRENYNHEMHLPSPEKSAASRVKGSHHKSRHSHDRSDRSDRGHSHDRSDREKGHHHHHHHHHRSSKDPLTKVH